MYTLHNAVVKDRFARIKIKKSLSQTVTNRAEVNKIKKRKFLKKQFRNLYIFQQKNAFKVRKTNYPFSKQANTTKRNNDH
jgi:hypothetical protein